MVIYHLKSIFLHHPTGGPFALPPGPDWKSKTPILLVLNVAFIHFWAHIITPTSELVRRMQGIGWVRLITPIPDLVDRKQDIEWVDPGKSSRNGSAN